MRTNMAFTGRLERDYRNVPGCISYLLIYSAYPRLVLILIFEGVKATHAY